MANSLQPKADPGSPLFLLPAMALQVSLGRGTDRHRHVAAQILVALEGELALRLSPQAPLSTCAAVLVPPNIAHHIVGPGPLALMVWFDPATPQARAIRARSSAEAVLIDKDNIADYASVVEQFRLPLQSCADVRHRCQAVTQALLPEWETLKTLDSRVESTVLAMQSPALLTEPYPLRTLAQGVNLSEGRLRHLFRQELGVSLQQFIRKQRSVLLRLAQFFALLMVGIQVGVSYSHLMQFPGKIQLPINLFIVVQTILIQYKLGLGIVEIGAFSLLGLILYLSHAQPRVFYFTLSAILLLLMAQAVWAVYIEPINGAIDTWTPASFPPNWEDYRRQWHGFHLARWILLTLGMGSLVASVLFREA